MSSTPPVQNAITIIDALNVIITASNVDNNNNKFIGVLDNNKMASLYVNNTSTKINIANNTIIKHIDIDNITGYVYLRCENSNMNGFIFNNITYSSNISRNALIILKPDTNTYIIDNVLWIDGIISFTVNNNNIHALIKLNEYNYPAVILNETKRVPIVRSATDMFTYLYLNIVYTNPLRTFTLMEILKGNSEYKDFIKTVSVIDNKNLLLTGYCQDDLNVSLQGASIAFNPGYFILSIILMETELKTMTYKYNDHCSLLGDLSLEKVIYNENDESIYLSCNINNEEIAVMFGNNFKFGTTFKRIRITSKYTHTNAILKIKLSQKIAELICAFQSNISPNVFFAIDKDSNLYYVTNTDDKGTFVINNDVYNVEKTCEVVVKLNNKRNILWNKEFRALPLSNTLVHNIYSKKDIVTMIGVANAKSIKLGNILYTSADDINKIYTLDFTNIEQFTNLTSESDFTPIMTLDLIKETTTITPKNTTTTNKKTIIIVSSVLGSLAVIVICVLLYLHFVKRII